jgi:hypothetical protein
MARSLLILSAAMLFLASCKPVDETESNEDMLRGGQWKRSSLKAQYRDAGGVIITEDAFATLPECIKDNTLKFDVNYKGAELRNGNKCSPGDPDETPVTWEFYNSGANLRIYNANETFVSDATLSTVSSINATVLSLSSTQLAMRYIVIEQDASTLVTDTVTFTDVFRR